MSRNNHNAPLTAHVVRYSSSLLLAALLAVSQAYALDSGDIVIVSLKGEVHVTMKGAERAVKAGAVLELPATVQTGRDGAIDLRQGATAVSVGPDTLLEFPALEQAGGPIDRIVQPRGNAFYSIGKRGARKLRVETPYLVGVVKGTQFNVAAQGDKTTISLFEGLLEIRASDDSSVVDIKAGEIATRSLVDTSIGVLRMDPGKAMPPPRVPQGARSENAPSPVAAPARAVPVDAGEAVPAAVDVAPAASVSAGDGAGAPSVDVFVGAGMNASAGAVLAAPPVEPSVNVSVDLGGNPGSIDVGAPTSVGAGVAVQVGGNQDAGNLDAGNVDLGVNLGGTDVRGGVDLGLGEDDRGQDSRGPGNGNAYGNGNGNAYGTDNGNGNAYGTDDSGNPGKDNGVDDVIDTVDRALEKLPRKPGKK